MSYQKKRTEPFKVEIKEKQIYTVTCDLCGKVHPEEHDDRRDSTFDGGIDWNTKNFGMDRVRIEREKGSYYPEDCGDRIETKYQVCGECFDTKIAPLFPKGAGYSSGIGNNYGEGE